MAYEILVVDDEKEIADLVEVYLKAENYTVHKCYTAEQALDVVDNCALDLAILDVMLPGVSGFDICSHIREKYTYPVIMLTAREQEIDKITGLTLGADDYVTKPFRPLELVARVKAQLRRSTQYNRSGAEENETIAISGLVLNRENHECFLNEKPLTLTPTEFSILWVLCQNRGRVVSTEELFRTVWGEKYFTSSSNTVMVHIRHLREKLGDSADRPRYIKTVWGVGYKVEK
ncbi:MAG TPA: VanR-ABDEGLN family response regulator transcription factor [Candidatus Ventrousia excrementavium]|uniref:Stage 0 sporulation protein A homolog n=1 Tax=Candidatus Ventrousia excrementavium TaxID=2840961 RepID=A0A9D1IUQ3_9CLOT|nr:VanR-ABDEGLN family response regulator transcription factor [Candidatus Ventrousia excrementavium]